MEDWICTAGKIWSNIYPKYFCVTGISPHPNTYPDITNVDKEWRQQSGEAMASGADISLLSNDGNSYGIDTKRLLYLK